MRKAHNSIIFSASDLSNHIHCKHLTNLNLEAINGKLAKTFTSNRSLELLRERGVNFEDNFLEDLIGQGFSIYKINSDDPDASLKTKEAMKSGYDYIYQARLSTDQWQGWADFLKKVEQPSTLGNWSYEVIDTKLSTNTRTGSILQITLYSELLKGIQGVIPEYMYIRNPEEEISFRVNDYHAYLRLIKRRLLEAVESPKATYPEPCSHCDVCNWWEHCNTIRRKDDHLSFIAGMGSSQIKEMKKHEVLTLESMSEVSLPISFIPTKGSKETFRKLREQARVQNISRTTQKPYYEILDLAGVEKYSLKDLEAYHQYTREMDLRTVSKIKANLEFLLEANQLEDITDEMRAAVQLYNQDDCFSTLKLHEWLENERQKLIDHGNVIPRPENSQSEPESVKEHLERITPILEFLLKDLPVDAHDRTKEEQGRYLLAHLLEWYRREEKSFWWEYFRILNLEPDEQLDEKEAISMLNYTGQREDIKRSVLDRYTFPAQEMDLKAGATVKDQDGNSLGEIYEIDEKNRIITLKKGPKTKDNHPISIIKYERISNKDKTENIIQFAEWIMENGFESPLNDYRVTRDILLNNNPRLQDSLPTYSDLVEKSIGWTELLDHSFLPIQGPPGAGKSYTASHIIFELIKKGKKVGITALSHKVIINLLKKVKEVADQHGYPLAALYKDSGKDSENEFWDIAKTALDVSGNIGNYSLFAGTSFMWCKEDLKNTLDYLFIDEAGQFALIETLVVSHVAKNIVFLGDHQQLSQPIKGVHPEGTDISALEHLLEGEKTIPEHKGIFLETTWRMHPDICSFDSEMFYESRLMSKDNLSHQKLIGNTEFAGAGLYYKSIEHEGNTNSSIEEVTLIKEIVNDLTKGDVYWVDKDQEKKLLQKKHIKIITPYNSNVYELQKEIPDVEIGTVDKFQGQEAPVILYSMASSSSEDAPRGMDFLYSPNRFNVAVSRAQIAFILVGNPRLFEPDCKSPVQMKLANPFCRFLELATNV